MKSKGAEPKVPANNGYTTGQMVVFQVFQPTKSPKLTLRAIISYEIPTLGIKRKSHGLIWTFKGPHDDKYAVFHHKTPQAVGFLLPLKSCCWVSVLHVPQEYHATLWNTAIEPPKKDTGNALVPAGGTSKILNQWQCNVQTESAVECLIQDLYDLLKNTTVQCTNNTTLIDSHMSLPSKILG